MHIFKRTFLKLTAFLLLLIFVNRLLIFALMPAGSFTRVMLHELYTDENKFDIVFSGSSLSYVHFNPEIIDKDMGVYSFNIGSSAQIYQGNYTLLKEMFAHHHPQYVVLTTEWTNYILKEESVVTYLSLVPYITNPFTRVEYLLNTGIEGSWRNRIFWWTGYHEKTLLGIIENIKIKLFDSDYLSYTYPEFDSEKYTGRGYVYRNTTEEYPVYNSDTYGKINRSYWNIQDANPKAIAMFEKIVKLCRKNDCELILVNPPRPKIDLLSVENYFEIDSYINDLAIKNGVKYFNYNLVKPEFFEAPDHYFYDHSHMNGTGATAFSHSFARFMNDYIAGKDVESYFYSPEEYLKSINYITNLWFKYEIKDGKVRIQADSLYGDLDPVYQFEMRNKNGELVLQRGYSKSKELEFNIPADGPYTLRVSAKDISSSEEYERYYEESIQFGGNN